MKSIVGQLKRQEKRQSEEISRIVLNAKCRNAYFFYIGGCRIVNINFTVLKR